MLLFLPLEVYEGRGQTFGQKQETGKKDARDASLYTTIVLLISQWTMIIAYICFL